MHALTTPLITKADGTKFGKSEGGAIWLDPDMTSPYAFYQFWLNQADADVVSYLKVFTFRSREEIAELEREVAERPFAREAQKALAGDVTTLVHGAGATEAVIAASQALFGRGSLDDLDARTLAGAVSGLPSVTAKAGRPRRGPPGGFGARRLQGRSTPRDRRGRRLREQREGRRPTTPRSADRGPAARAGTRCCAAGRRRWRSRRRNDDSAERPPTGRMVRRRSPADQRAAAVVHARILPFEPVLPDCGQEIADFSDPDRSVSQT